MFGLVSKKKYDELQQKYDSEYYKERARIFDFSKRVEAEYETIIAEKDKEIAKWREKYADELQKRLELAELIGRSGMGDNDGFHKCNECYYLDEDGNCKESCIENAMFTPERPNERVLEWISVKDRLPEENLCVLVYVGYGIGVSMSAHRTSNGKFFRYGDDVTHWMPLPEPPKGE